MVNITQTEVYEFIWTGRNKKEVESCCNNLGLSFEVIKNNFDDEDCLYVNNDYIPSNYKIIATKFGVHKRIRLS